MSTTDTLRPGLFLSFEGMDGSGKTTLLHALAGLTPARGTVAIDALLLQRSQPNDQPRLLNFLFRSVLQPVAVISRPNSHVSTLCESIGFSAWNVCSFYGTRLNAISNE